MRRDILADSIVDVGYLFFQKWEDGPSLDPKTFKTRLGKALRDDDECCKRLNNYLKRKFIRQMQEVRRVFIECGKLILGLVSLHGGCCLFRWMK